MVVRLIFIYTRLIFTRISIYYAHKFIYYAIRLSHAYCSYTRKSHTIVITRTSVRLYMRIINQMNGFPTHYKLRIYEIQIIFSPLVQIFASATC